MVKEGVPTASGTAGKGTGACGVLFSTPQIKTEKLASVVSTSSALAVTLSYNPGVRTTAIPRIVGLSTIVGQKLSTFFSSGEGCLIHKNCIFLYAGEFYVWWATTSEQDQAEKFNFSLSGGSKTRISCSLAHAEPLQIVQSTIAKQLSIDESAVTPQTKFADLGADSLDTVEIMMSLEEKFGVSIGEGGAENISTVQDAANLIEKVKAASA
ncbi:hypothetical protein L6164_021357 [Bauhinia variegata]|uniref:Uncharacterized protein n=1 Tax=Bauhinia variegata TaxID=167791 RepID=A0ACB9MXZ2_BAUVA|nr:hypothetical protein L6164_021357 [Bauhinia variegata]